MDLSSIRGGEYDVLLFGTCLCGVCMFFYYMCYIASGPTFLNGHGKFYIHMLTNEPKHKFTE